MKTFETTNGRSESIDAPAVPEPSFRALEEWVLRSQLPETIPNILNTVNGPQADAAGNPRNGAAGGCEAMLAILIYCYAIGIYRSREIEQRLRRNHARTQLPFDARLDGAAFAQLRRTHASLIKQCLVCALQQAFRVRWNRGGHARAWRSGLASSDTCPALDSKAPSLLDCEAERRLGIAEAWDRFDQDGWIVQASISISKPTF